MKRSPSSRFRRDIESLLSGEVNKHWAKPRERRLARYDCANIGAVWQCLNTALLRAASPADLAGCRRRDGWPYFSNSRHHVAVSAQKYAICSVGGAHGTQHRAVVATAERSMPP